MDLTDDWMSGAQALRGRSRLDARRVGVWVAPAGAELVSLMERYKVEVVPVVRSAAEAMAVKRGFPMVCSGALAIGGVPWVAFASNTEDDKIIGTDDASLRIVDIETGERTEIALVGAGASGAHTKAELKAREDAKKPKLATGGVVPTSTLTVGDAELFTIDVSDLTLSETKTTKDVTLTEMMKEMISKGMSGTLVAPSTTAPIYKSPFSTKGGHIVLGPPGTVTPLPPSGDGEPDPEAPELHRFLWRAPADIWNDLKAMSDDAEISVNKLLNDTVAPKVRAWRRAKSTARPEGTRFHVVETYLGEDVDPDKVDQLRRNIETMCKAMGLEGAFSTPNVWGGTDDDFEVEEEDDPSPISTPATMLKKMMMGGSPSAPPPYTHTIFPGPMPGPGITWSTSSAVPPGAAIAFSAPWFDNEAAPGDPTAVHDFEVVPGGEITVADDRMRRELVYELLVEATMPIIKARPGDGLLGVGVITDITVSHGATFGGGMVAKIKAARDPMRWGTSQRIADLYEKHKFGHAWSFMTT